MAKQQQKVTYNLPMSLACVLLCLTLLSFYFTGDLYARYTVSEKGGDGAWVAVMATDVQLVLEDAYICPGETKEIVLTVANYQENRICEVAQKYSVKVTSLLEKSNIPLEIQIYEISEDDTTETRVTGGIEKTFLAGVKEKDQYRIMVVWPEEENSAAYAFELDAIAVTINAEQVD